MWHKVREMNLLGRIKMESQIGNTEAKKDSHPVEGIYVISHYLEPKYGGGGLVVGNKISCFSSFPQNRP